MKWNLENLSENDTLNILIVGVGGQGSLLISKIIGKAALSAGKKVTISEIHGMAQRGGVVETLVRLGEDESPVTNDIHILLSLEPAEVLRNLHRLRQDTVIITSENEIVPFTVSLGVADYPDISSSFSKLREKFSNFISVDALKLAKEAGNPITSNVVLLGCLSALKVFPLQVEVLEETLKNSVPSGTEELNLRAFKLGREYIFSAKKKKESLNG